MGVKVGLGRKLVIGRVMASQRASFPLPAQHQVVIHLQNSLLNFLRAPLQTYILTILGSYHQRIQWHLNEPTFTVKRSSY